MVTEYVTKDFVLQSDSDIGAMMGPAARFDANVEAITVLKQIEAENRTATPDEQAIMAKYSGFGDSAFSAAFPRYDYFNDKSWERRHNALKEATTEEEFDAIKKSRMNAFYTTPDVVKAMWEGLKRLGV